VQKLIVPILETVRTYGLKARNLRKFEPLVDRFYSKNIDNTTASHELVAKYQKRFRRYKESLFVFLGGDGVPWHNNTAENAIRPLAILRKISGYFYKSVAPQYLVLLGISQTCKYENVSFLQFLLSEETDINALKSGRRMKSSG